MQAYILIPPEQWHFSRVMRRAAENGGPRQRFGGDSGGARGRDSIQLRGGDSGGEADVPAESGGERYFPHVVIIAFSTGSLPVQIAQRLHTYSTYRVVLVLVRPYLVLVLKCL